MGTDTASWFNSRVEPYRYLSVSINNTVALLKEMVAKQEAEQAAAKEIARQLEEEITPEVIEQAE